MIITDSILVHQANTIARLSPAPILTPEGHQWRATAGWLYRWKQQNNIHAKVKSGEKRSADLASAATGKLEIARKLLVGRFDDAHRMNMDETGLYWRAIPTRSLVRSEEDSEGFKKLKNRITLCVFSTADGSFFDFWVIGKAKTPRCFRNVEVPLRKNYRNSKKAWNTTAICVEMMQVVQRNLSQQGKYALILDNASVHPEGMLREALKERFEIFMLPPNTTSLIQPNDQGVLCLLSGISRKQESSRP
jgi:hypothetical protein